MFPGIIIVTDEYPRRNGAGIGQAMYNLFNRYTGNLWVLMTSDELLPPSQEGLQANTLRYCEPGPKPLLNRLGKWVNPLLKRWQFNNRSVQLLPNGMPSPKKAMVLVSTTSPAKLHMAWLLQQKMGYKVVPYFMDDWIAGNTFSWKGGSIVQIARDLLAGAPARIMISRNLQMSLEQRYLLSQVPTLVVQNPCPTPVLEEHELFSDRQKEISPQVIIYAGSIWPMHADALIALAQAVHRLNGSGTIHFSLVLYSPERHWKKYCEWLRGPGVSGEGWFAQVDELRMKLPEADLLLCCASFAPENAPFSTGSIQSKITEYLSAGRPVLYVGPTNGVSGQFVQEWNCGFTIFSSDPTAIGVQLKSIHQNTEEWQLKAKTALRLAKTTFSQDTVQQKLYNFLNKINHSDPNG